MHSFSNALVHSYVELYPVFKIVPIVLIVLVITFRNRVARLFNIYVAFSYILFAVGQNIAVTERYGLSICTVNLIMFPVVAGFWIWEAIVLQNDFGPAKIPIWRYWVVPLALLAFLAPGKPRAGMPGFSPAYLFTNGAGAAFCMMTPVYVGMLTLYWPKVNLPTLRVTSLVGLIIGLYNMGTNFLVSPGTRWWNGVLHIPLLSISVYGLILSLKKVPCRQGHSKPDVL
jgi:hypothetical protein